MSLWEFSAAVGGVAQANGAEATGLTREDAAEAAAMLDAWPGTKH